MTTERKNNISFQLIFPEVELVRKDSDGFYKVKPKKSNRSSNLYFTDGKSSTRIY